MAADDQQTSESAAPATKLGGAYSHYVLFVLVIVYVFNFIDRNILSILSQDIQADLGVSDAEMGFSTARYSRCSMLYSASRWHVLRTFGCAAV